MDVWFIQSGNEKSCVTVAVRALHSKALIHLERCWISSASTRPETLSKCSGAWDIWGTDLNISHLRCKWIGPPGLQSCQQLTLYESFIHQHIFPCEQQLLKKKVGKKYIKTFFFLKTCPFLACWISMWHCGTFVELNHELVPVRLLYFSGEVKYQCSHL